MPTTVGVPSRRGLMFGSIALAIVCAAMPSTATMPSWDQATMVDRERLLAAARTHLSQAEATLLEQAIATVDGFKPRRTLDAKGVMGALVPLQQRRFVLDVVSLVRPVLARGDRINVDAFFGAINRQKLVRGYGEHHLVRGGYGGPLSVEFALRTTQARKYAIEVWYRFLDPVVVQGERREGTRFLYPTDVAVP